MKTIGWISLRLMLEILRDKRTLAFFILVPLLVMTLVYLALDQEENARIGVLARGAARFFVYDLKRALGEEKDVEVVTLDIPDEMRNPKALEAAILDQLRQGKVEGVLYFGEDLLVDRFDGKRGNLILFLEGSRPTLTALVGSAVASASDDLASKLPTVIAAECSAMCANSVNTKPLNLEKRYLYGSEDIRTIDFFLPVLPPFFVFFLTFILTNVGFQRERVRGTLERMLIAPVGLMRVVLGYMGGFFLFSSIQAGIVITYLLALIDFPIAAWQVAGLALVVLFMMLIALLLGLLVSLAARNEFQAIQFVPVVILPQVFFGDMIWSIESFPWWLRWLGYVLPITHANITTRNLLLKQQSLWDSWPNLLALVGFLVVLLLLLMAAGSRHIRKIA